MKRITTITLALFLMASGLKAQQVQTQTQGGPATMTLEQCIQYALENSVNVQNAILDEDIATAKVKETVGIGLPQINGSASANYNPNLPRFFATKGTAYNFSGGTIPIDQFLPGVGMNDVVAMAPFFSLKGNGNANVAVTQMIFNGSYLVGLQATQTFKDLSIKTTRQTKEQTVENVRKAFYSALINYERSKLFDNNIARVDSLLRNTKALNANGFAESIDVDRIQVSLNNLITERDKFLKLQELSLELLKFQMNYPMEGNLQVTGEISKDATNVDWDSYLDGWSKKERTDYQLLETNRKAQQLTLKNKYAAALPSLSANLNYGYSTQSPTIGGIFKTNSNFSENSGVGPDKWYKVSSYGVSLNVPIFSGLQRNYQIQQEKIRLRKIENTFKTLESSIDLEVKQSTIGYQNALSSLDAQQRNMDLAAKVARVTRIKYEQGVGSNIEVIDAESSLKESQVNYYNALYDALVAKTDLDKAFGKLLPASTATPK